jgi:hypothetical protein
MISEATWLVITTIVLCSSCDGVSLKGHGNEADFLGFLQKLVQHRSLTLHFECSDFGFKFAEIFVIEKESSTHRVGESDCL